jgi:hypothetical protein
LFATALKYIVVESWIPLQSAYKAKTLIFSGIPDLRNCFKLHTVVLLHLPHQSLV